MTLAIQGLRGRRFVTGDELESFLRAHSFPLVEGHTVTIMWRGEAERVHLRHWIYGLPSSQALRRLEGSDMWFLSMDLPPGSRIASARITSSGWVVKSQACRYRRSIRSVPS